MKFKNILCPFDYSRTSQAALEKAADLVRQFNATLHIVQVYEFLFIAEACAETMAPIPVSPDVESLKRKLAKVGPDDINIQRDLIYGIPGGAILNYARANDIDLIVIGPRSDLGALRWLIGSVTESVMRLAPCPVLVVHNEGPFSESAQVTTSSAASV